MRALVCLLMLLALPAPTFAQEDGGLVRAPGWEIAARHCGACHAYRLVTSQRGDARFWTDVIRWMQRTQGLWPIEAAEEAALIAYLADTYGETDWGRRPALPPRLLPEAPER